MPILSLRSHTLRTTDLNEKTRESLNEKVRTVKAGLEPVISFCQRPQGRWGFQCVHCVFGYEINAETPTLPAPIHGARLPSWHPHGGP